MVTSINGTVQVSIKIHSKLITLAEQYKDTPAVFFGKVDPNRIARLAIMAHLYRINYENIQAVVALRAQGFPSVELILQECPNCKFIIDEQCFPVLQRRNGEFWKCNVCGARESD
jgi:hypothetical protein